MESQRVDKWLWCVRIFKSRTLAAKMCKAKNVKVNGKNAKPSSAVVVGDMINVDKNGFNFLFEVKGLLKSRVSFVLAQPNYVDHTPEEELNKYKSWFVGKASAELREKGLGRPTKKERREIDEFKEDFYSNWDEDM